MKPAQNININQWHDHAVTLVLTYGPRVVLGIIILILGEWLIRFLKKRLMRRMNKRNFHSSLRPFFQSLIFTSMQVLLLLMIMQIIGIQLTVFTALIAAFGAAAGFALSGTLQNFASGVLILLLKPFEIDDNIIAQGQEGTVTDIRLFYSVIKTYDNKYVVVPNSKLSNEIIVNITREGKRRLDIPLDFDLSFDFAAVKKMIEQTVAASEDLFKEAPDLRIGVSAVAKDKFTVTTNVWINAHGFEDTRLAFQERLLKALQSYLSDNAAKKD